MVHTGDVTLPDGRIVHGQVTAHYDGGWDGTGACEINDDSLQLEWKDGAELTVDEMNEDLGAAYLHEYVAEQLLLMPGEYPEP